MSKLQLKWVYHPIYASNSQSKMENTPLVVDGVMYTGTFTELCREGEILTLPWNFALQSSSFLLYNRF